MSPSKAWVALVVWSLIPAASAFAQQPPRDVANVSLSPEFASNAEIKYRKKWAVIVGVDYKSNDRPQDLGKIPALTNAQHDAVDVHDMLTSKFGFSPSDASLFLGPSATKGKVLGKIGEFAAGAKVTAEDCVLVYFSGHGVVQPSKDDGRLGYLVPIDVEWMENNQPNPATAIGMKEVVEYLNRCPARHKILILDCCHSGLVFTVDVMDEGQDADAQQRGPDVFASPTFQAISASRDNQKASDGLHGHSPFTFAILESLKTLPLEYKRDFGRPEFTASQLFEKMKPYLRGESQTAQCRRMQQQTGEFHFLPDRSAIFNEAITGDSEQAELLATSPTVFGNWWAVEAPWFMPGLRLTILEHGIQNRSALYELDREGLEGAARQALKNLKTTSAIVDDVVKMRYRHLDMLINAASSDQRRVSMGKIAAELESKKKELESNEKTLEPPDLHYLAVIYQLLRDFPKADECYKRAINEYDKMPPARGAKLQSLCHMDAMMLAISQNKPDDAKDHLDKARKQLNKREPVPFQIFALCREADLFRLEGKFELSWSRMDQAENLCTRWDQHRGTLLSSYIVKTRAWGYMESWNFKKASKDFIETEKILTGSCTQSQSDAAIDLLHVRHGLAMVERFQGRTAAGLAAYRKLTPEIATQLRELDRNEDNERYYADIRNQLLERAVNSLERQADCLLFGDPADYAEAADDYRRALGACEYLPKAGRDTSRIDILYRRAVALALHANELAKRERDSAVGQQDADLALQLCLEADAIAAALRGQEGLEGLSPRTELAKRLAGACLTLIDRGTEECWKNQEELAVNPSDYNRDELERLMFLYKTLIVHRDDFRISPYVSQGHVARLLTLCRSACRVSPADLEVLAYLRPYYDAAFAAQSELRPGDVKALIEIAFEATRGEPYVKRAASEPRVVMYLAAGKCHLLLDAPHGVSKQLVLSDVSCAQDLVTASTTGEHYPLPDAVRYAIRDLRHTCPEQAISLCWRDPVLKLGYSDQVIDVGGAEGRGGLSHTSLRVTHNFPFILQGTLKPDEYTEDVNPITIPPHSPTRPPANPSEGAPPTPRPELSSDAPAETVSNTRVN